MAASITLASCSVGDPTVGPSAQLQSPAATSAPGTPGTTGTPSVSPSPDSPSGAPAGKVPVDSKASLAVSPVDYNGKNVVVATFGTAMASRPVSLQHKTGAGWEQVASDVQDSDGVATFFVPVSDADYRAVAVDWTSPSGKERKAVATPSASADDQWRSALSTDFSGSSLPSQWDHRNLANYQAGGRQCSAVYASNAKIEDGKLVLSMTKETRAANIKKAKAAGCTKGQYYRNAMVSTEHRFGVRTGLVAARVKFPMGQGMHGSVWLQSRVWSEIDFVESYGYGKGLTSVVHINQKRYPAKGSQAYVNTEAVKDRAWWDQYHVYSVEWDRSELVFRIDGVETKRIAKSVHNTDYFLVISLLSSDWELKRLKDPIRRAEGVGPTKLPQSMSVDWVKVWKRA